MSAQIMRKSLDTWLSLRVELSSALLLLLLALLVVYGIIPREMAGLTLSTVMAIAKNVSSLVWTLVELEIKMIPVERLKRYCDEVPREHEANMNSTLADYRLASPPQRQSNDTSAVEMSHVTVKYPSRPAPGLDGINLHIKRGERVGIVGRSGTYAISLPQTILGSVTCGNLRVGAFSTIVSRKGLSLVVTELF